MPFPTVSVVMPCMTAPMSTAEAYGRLNAPARDISANDATPATSEPEKIKPPANDMSSPAADLTAGICAAFLIVFIYVSRSGTK